GSKNIYCQSSDSLGPHRDWAQMGTWKVVKPDTTPPTGTIQIDNSAAYANKTSVTLTLSATDTDSGVNQMQLSNDNLTWLAPEPYATTKSWNLTPGEGKKTVYAKYSDKSGNWSSPVSATIILDTTPPVIIITSPQNGVVVDNSLVQLQGAVDGVAFSESRSLNSGENTLTKTATDLAGNTASVSITVYLYMGQVIGAQGGEVISPDGKVKIIIPQGALTQPANIKILTINDSSVLGIPPGNKTLLSAVECKPYGLTFTNPVEIIYTLSHAEVPGTPVELGLYDSVQKKIITTGQTSTVPVDGYTLSFNIMHFSTYAALKSLTPQSAPIGSGVKIPLPDLLTGAFSHSIPISLPPGRKGMQPQLAFVYRSSGANSWVGLGFNLNPGYIVRSTRLGPPKYIDNQDTFYLITDAGTTELINLIDNLYQAKVESGFTKFFKEADDSWRVVAKDGSILRFGQTSGSKEVSQQGTFSWFLTKTIDTNGNFVEYNYTIDQGKCYLSGISYTGNENGLSPSNSVEFLLESRYDVTSSYISTSKIVSAKRLKEMQVKAGNDLVWRYELEYAYSPDTNRSLLKSVKQFAADGKSLPQQSLSYQSRM
ncbi:MAG: SpvB/TcaC N-terminal domain-containing protein, partial [Dehalococcoidales bacterium]|nr:SpvB/TcaC N-terminal domain-containing protein [Dehalococcoidales bacterium]